jgi:hypothetical protein
MSRCSVSVATCNARSHSAACARRSRVSMRSQHGSGANVPAAADGRSRSYAAPPALLLQLSLQSVAVGYVHRLYLLELPQQRPCLHCIVTAAFQLCDDLALARDVLRSEPDVLLSEGQLLHPLLAVHRTMLPDEEGGRPGAAPSRASSSAQR